MTKLPLKVNLDFRRYVADDSVSFPQISTTAENRSSCPGQEVLGARDQPKTRPSRLTPPNTNPSTSVNKRTSGFTSSPTVTRHPPSGLQICDVVFARRAWREIRPRCQVWDTGFATQLANRGERFALVVRSGMQSLSLARTFACQPPIDRERCLDHPQYE